MECINQVILQGTVGAVRINEMSDTKVARFSVCTTRAYKGVDGTPILESMWHDVLAFESKDNRLDGIEKGAKVRVEGFLRAIKYTDVNGVERSTVETVAKKTSIISEII